MSIGDSSGANPLTLEFDSAKQTFANNGTVTTIWNGINDEGGVKFTGAGTTYLYGNSSISGVFTQGLLINIPGGTMYINGNVNVGYRCVVQGGTVVYQGGTSNWDNSSDLDGVNGGTLNVTGGSLTMSPTPGEYFRVSSGNSAMTVSGGTFVLGAPYFGVTVYIGGAAGTAGQNIFTVSGSGVADLSQASAIDLGNTSASSGTINLLSGGLLKLGAAPIALGVAFASGSLNLNGGTLQATSDNSSLFTFSSFGSVAAFVGPAGALIDTQSNSVTFNQGLQSGAVNDGGLTKYGPGILTLTGSNTYVGATTISAGTLQIGTGGQLNTAGLITVNSNATLAFSGSDTPTQGTNFSSSSITGAGGLSMVGTGGLLTLTATNTYNGPTTVTAGTLAVNGALTQTSTISVGTTGTLAGSGLIGGTTTPTTLTGNAAINLSGGTIGGPLNVTGGNWTGFGTVSGLVTSSSNVFAVASGGSLNAAGNMLVNSGGLLTVAGSGSLNVAGNMLVAGGGTLTGLGAISGGTVTLGSGAVIAPGATPAAGNVGTLALPSFLSSGGGMLGFDLSNSGTVGGGVNDLLQVAGNLSLGGTTTLAIYPTAGSLATGTPYTLFTYGGNLSHSGTISLAPGSIGGRETAAFNYGTGSNSAVTMTLSGYNANLTWIGTSSTTWVNNASIKPWTSPTSPAGDFFTTNDYVTFDNNALATSVSLSGTLLPASLTVTGTNNFTFSGGGAIGGLTGLTVIGPGSLTISNTGNYYGGPTLIQGGTLALGANNALPASTSLVLGSAAADGTFDLAGFSQTLASLGTDPSATTANQTIGNSAAATTATLTISSSSTNGGMTIYGSSTYGGSIQDGFNGAGGRTALTVGAGLLNLSGSNTYTGPTTIATAGTLQLGGNSALGGGANAGNLVANGLLDLAGYHAVVSSLSGSGTVGDSGGAGSLTFGNNTSSTFSGLLTGGYNTSLTKNGTGTFVLTGTNVVANTVINQGTYQIGNGVLNGSAGSATQYNIAPGARLYFNQGASPNPNIPWSGVSGGGTLELGNAVPTSAGYFGYSEMTLPPGFTGTLQLDSNGSFGSGPTGLGQAATVILNNGTALSFDDGTNNPATLPQNFTISSSGGITSNMIQADFTGHLTLTADSRLEAAGDFQDDPAITVSGVISGNHGLFIGIDIQNILIPTPLVIFAGANTYSGTTEVVLQQNGLGHLQLSNSAALQNSTLTTGGILFDPDGAGTQSFVFGGLSGTGAIALSDSTTTVPIALSIGNNNSSTTFSGRLSGIGSLAKIGTGSLTLSGTNTYTGGTTVAGGELILTNKYSVEDGSNLFVGTDLLAFGTAVPAEAAAGQAVATVPEPGTFAQAAAAIGGLLLYRRKRRNALLTLRRKRGHHEGA